MGFITTTNEKGREVYCCEKCNEYPARVHHCPHKYCQRYYFCAKCWKEIKKEKWGKIHSDCERLSNEFNEIKVKEQTLLNEGKFVRSSALNIGNGIVQVWFKNKAGIVISYTMGEDTYRAIPLISPVVVEDFALLGWVQGAV